SRLSPVTRVPSTSLSSRRMSRGWLMGFASGAAGSPVPGSLNPRRTFLDHARSSVGGFGGAMGPLADMHVQLTSGQGFLAALDQSGGSTPDALRQYGVPESAYGTEA